MSAKAPSKVSTIVVTKSTQADEIEDSMFDDIKVGIAAKQVNFRQGSVAT